MNDFDSSVVEDKSDNSSLGTSSNNDGDSLSKGGFSSSDGATDNKSTSSGSSGDDPQQAIEAKKTAAVNRLRFLVVVVLVVAAFGVSFTVFVLSRKADREAFEIQYEGNVDKILETFEGIFEQVGSSLGGLGLDITAYSEDNNSNWPFQTMSNFHGRAGNVRALSGALYIAVNHLVSQSQKNEWEEYVLSNTTNKWIDESWKFQENLGVNTFEDPQNILRSRLHPERKVDPIHYFTEDGSPRLAEQPDADSGMYLARWQTSPVLKSGKINGNLFQEEGASEPVQYTVETQSATLSSFMLAPYGPPSSTHPLTSFFATLRSIKEGKETNYLGDPMAFFVLPLFDVANHEKRKLVGVIKSAIHWKSYFENILPNNVNGITLVLENVCSDIGAFTYEIQGTQVFSVGPGDLHNPNYDHFERYASSAYLNKVEDGSDSDIEWNLHGCPYSLRVYPSRKYYNYFVSSDPINVTFAVGMVFFYTIILFIFYDRLVESRQRLILAKATKSTAIVSSLFPKNVRDRLLQVDEGKTGGGGNKMFASAAPTQRLKTFLGGDTEGANAADAQPIADLFPHCTVLFADIAGFTAWSSTREPAQVFVLLQTVYQAFDTLAKRRRVFKVETIGDSYVAVTGLPEPQSNHAVIMVRFAGECMMRMNEVTKELEVSLGPDTGDLGMRFGLHSGPVTAGVLRGDRARFQLFGDTVNTAARMESTGTKNRIQCSQATADLLLAAGKKHWVRAREDAVEAKGKGVLNTFWLNPTSKTDSSATSSDNDGALVSLDGDSANPSRSNMANDANEKKKDRLVDWMVEILLFDIRKIISVRQASRISKRPSKLSNGDVTYLPPEGVICLDEVQKALNMHKFDADTAAAIENGQKVDINKEVIKQLKAYVTIIADSYKDNPFHNFSHACHVTMSVHKLLTRIVAPDIAPDKFDVIDENELARHLNDYSHGIVHDPMAIFAITFSALIHDVDHQGVSNTQLSKENPDIAKRYRDKSVAEQNSLDIAWDVLMMPQFRELRQLIFETKEELMRFRELIVNVVLATDIFDKELNDLRKTRWTQAFSESTTGGSEANVNDLRATIVIEHIIQASDVSHTMQHWHVYRKWNASLFKEMYLAYKAGRMGADPSTFWYKGEIGFFDNYVIPLAKKLKECNVFGVSSDEYLNYAMMNRAEWEERGMDVVNELVAECSKL